LNKKKIINDPVYGFISIPTPLLFDVIEHPYFQRLRRIKQLGLTDFVYPGALHTRFHHALGAMHLMRTTLDHLRARGVAINDTEYEAALLAILLHDVGHGPFSHALEHTLLQQVGHESLSLLLMEYFRELFEHGPFDLAIQMFKGQYSRPFFNQLISSQLDIDRLDYLVRDSFFTGVSEGNIGAERIIKMLAVESGQLVVEEKGIYSIENFLSARRLMYWQVYLHKATVSAEKMFIQLIKRARHLALNGQQVFATPALGYFLNHEVRLQNFTQDAACLGHFAALDDFDIWACVKIWQDHPDKVLSLLSSMLLQRRLFRVRLSAEAPGQLEMESLRQRISAHYGLSSTEAAQLIVSGSISNSAYIREGQKIFIRRKGGEILDIADASDLPNISAMSKIVTKYYLCWPKSVSL